MWPFNSLKKNNIDDKPKLADEYIVDHHVGATVMINGRKANLWLATPMGGEKTEYFLVDRELCWNYMCMLSNNKIPFVPSPYEFRFRIIDLTQFHVKDKYAWVFKTL